MPTCLPPGATSYLQNGHGGQQPLPATFVAANAVPDSSTNAALQSAINRFRIRPSFRN